MVGTRQAVGVTASVTMTLVFGGSIALFLMTAGPREYPGLHTVLDTASCLLAGMLALLLWNIGRRAPLMLAAMLSLAFGAAFLASLIHVAATLDWFGDLGWMQKSGQGLRPSTWPVALHVLAAGVLGSLWIRSTGDRTLWLFGTVLLLLVGMLLWLFTRIPGYSEPLLLGITRPALIAGPLLWAVVALISLRRRRSDRLYPMLTLMAATLVVANVLILFSRSPADGEAMASHALTIAALLSLILLKLRAATLDARALLRTERDLKELNAQLELRVAERTSELRKMHDTAQAIVDTALDGLIVMDGNGRIEGFSPAAERIFGVTAGAAVGRELADVLIPPEMRERHREGMAIHLATGSSRILGRRVEVEGLRADGTRVPLELTVNRVAGEGHPRFAGFVRDLTERRVAERRLAAQHSRLDLLNRISRAIGERQDLRSILQVTLRRVEEDLPVDFSMMCIYDQFAASLTVSAIGANSHDFARRLGMAESDALPIDRNGLARAVGGTLVYEPETEASPHAFPARLARAGLRSFVAAPLQAESRVFGMLIAARRDSQAFSSGDCEFLRQLSEHVALAANQAETYEALQRAYDDLRLTQQAVMQQERLRALGQMASGIAHDINNAISPVALYAEALLEREPGVSDTGRGYLKVIQRAMEDVVQTVGRMREFYRVHPPSLELKPVNLSELSLQVLDITRARWSDMPQQRGLVIRPQVELARGLPDVAGVESEIREALINLVFNAVDAMAQGGTLTVRTGVEARTSEVFVEVCDTGHGMDEDTQRRCLEPFFTTKGERGTGLGLAMVYGTVQRHGADLRIDSRVDSGTAVRITFSNRATAPAGSASVTGNVPIVRRMRVLVIDDDPLLLKSLRDILEGDGHQVTTANGGREGIEAFGESLKGAERFTVVITDLGMPHMDGRQVASAIKSLSATTPIILLTGWGQRLLDDGDLPLHVDQVLSKPPKLRVLREALSRCMG